MRDLLGKQPMIFGICVAMEPYTNAGRPEGLRSLRVPAAAKGWPHMNSCRRCISPAIANGTGITA